jgi:CRISPR/Cas system-associated endonuclease Cas1
MKTKIIEVKGQGKTTILEGALSALAAKGVPTLFVGTGGVPWSHFAADANSQLERVRVVAIDDVDKLPVNWRETLQFSLQRMEHTEGETQIILGGSLW